VTQPSSFPAPPARSAEGGAEAATTAPAAGHGDVFASREELARFAAEHRVQHELMLAADALLGELAGRVELSWIRMSLSRLPLRDVGSLAGAERHAPRGLAGAVAAAAAMKILRLDAVLGWPDVILLAVPAAILGQLGDLAESLLKRSVGVKDSGTLLPGHGGILDRIDAVLFIAPYTYLYLIVRPHLF
jgi:hypothetical protein